MYQQAAVRDSQLHVAKQMCCEMAAAANQTSGRVHNILILW